MVGMEVSPRTGADAPLLLLSRAWRKIGRRAIAREAGKRIAHA
jgi:hypothetical protein